VTIVDSGLDVAHPEFLGRADTQALNAQEPAPFGGEHGTMVSSVIAAPLNGVGLVGIYPRAVLRSWDAAKGDGTRLESSEISAGLLAAARAGRGVINLSLGSDVSDLSIELAVGDGGRVWVARRRRVRERRRPGKPARLSRRVPRTSRPSPRPTGAEGSLPFSSRSRYVDLAAPG
jgi:subtilisin family serine protease